MLLSQVWYNSLPSLKSFFIGMYSMYVFVGHHKNLKTIDDGKTKFFPENMCLSSRLWNFTACQARTWNRHRADNILLMTTSYRHWHIMELDCLIGLKKRGHKMAEI